MTRAEQIAERSRLDQEIRFIKTQQLAISTACVTLLGTIFGIGQLFRPLHWWDISIHQFGFVLPIHRDFLGQHPDQALRRHSSALGKEPTFDAKQDIAHFPRRARQHRHR